ncbi:ash family protein [Salmonella enterica]|nr:ash family protein [Salmonella enterica]EGL7477248.1 ash family protein [Salmonella enterica]EIZ2333803.1 ash family protein [Salmonella enterica]
MPGQSKKSLNTAITGWYVPLAATLLAVGNLTPGNTKATPDANSVFFIVATNATNPFYVVMRIMIAVLCFIQPWTRPGASHHRVMVALAGPTSVGPGSFVSGSEIPVRAIASEHLTSCDSSMLITKEAAIMATNPTKKHPKSAIPQLSHNCRRKIYRTQMVSLYLSVDMLCRDFDSLPAWLPHVIDCIHDDIKAIDNELISLGLFDEAMGKRPRKPDAK